MHFLIFIFNYFPTYNILAFHKKSHLHTPAQCLGVSRLAEVFFLCFSLYPFFFHFHFGLTTEQCGLNYGENWLSYGPF